MVAHAWSTRAAPRIGEVRRSRLSSSSVSRSPAVTGAPEESDMAPMIPDSGGGDEPAEPALASTGPVSRISGMAGGSRPRLIIAGLIVALIGLFLLSVNVL